MRKRRWLLAFLLVLCCVFFACTACGETDDTTAPVITASCNKTQITAGEQITLTYSATENAQITVTYTKDGAAASGLEISSGVAFTIEDAGTYVFTFSATGAEPVTVTVTVTEVQKTQYNITYSIGDHAAEGANVPAQGTAEEGVPFNLPGAIEGEFGYAFAGWVENGNTHAANSSFIATANTQFTAKWNFVGGEFQDAEPDRWGSALNGKYMLADGESLEFTAALSGEMSQTAWEDGIFVQINDGTTQYFFRPANTWWSGANNETNPNGVVTRDFASLPDLVGHDEFNTLKQNTRIVVTRTGNQISVAYDFGIVVVGFTVQNVTAQQNEVYFILYDYAADQQTDNTWIEASDVHAYWRPAMEKPTPDPAIRAAASAQEIVEGGTLTLTYRATHMEAVTVTYTKDGQPASGLEIASGVAFEIEEAGTYVFTFSAEGADPVTITVTVKEPHVHHLDAWTVNAPTMSKEGSAERTCTDEDCDKSTGWKETVTLPSLATEGAYQSTETTKADCETDGITSYIYTEENITFDVKVPKLGHKYTAVTVTYNAETHTAEWTATVLCENNGAHQLSLTVPKVDDTWTLDRTNGYTAPSHTADGSGNYSKVVEQDGYRVTVTVTGVPIPTNATHIYAKEYDSRETYTAGETTISCTYEGCSASIQVTLPELPQTFESTGDWTWEQTLSPQNGEAGSGTFKCTVQEKDGENTASITVRVSVPAPVISAQASAEKVAPGEELTLTYSATENAEVTVTYTKNGEAASGLEITSGEAFTIEEEGEYIFTFSADGAKDVTVSVTVEKRNLALDEDGWTTFKPDTWTFSDGGATNTENAAFLANFLIRPEKLTVGDYALETTFKAASGTVTEEINIGVIPWFKDAQNYVAIYLKWAPDHGSNLFDLLILYFKDGVQHGVEDGATWNDRWLDGGNLRDTLYTLNPDDAITLRVEKRYNAATGFDDYTVIISATNKAGKQMEERFTESYSVSAGQEGGMGLYSFHGTVTFSSLTVEKLLASVPAALPALLPQTKRRII